MRKKANWGADHERSTEAPEHGTEPVFPTSTRENKVASGKERRAKERERNRGVERAGAALISENLQFASGVDSLRLVQTYLRRLTLGNGRTPC